MTHAQRPQQKNSGPEDRGRGRISQQRRECVSASALMASRAILNDWNGHAVFIGQVLSDRSVSITNVINAKHGVCMISDVKIAEIAIESVLKQDTPIPLRFPDEVLVYYDWYWGSGQKPIQLKRDQRKRFHCDRGTVLGQTNVLILFAASDASGP